MRITIALAMNDNPNPLQMWLKKNTILRHNGNIFNLLFQMPFWDAGYCIFRRTYWGKIQVEVKYRNDQSVFAG